MEQEYKIKAPLVQKLIDLIITNCVFLDCVDPLRELKEVIESQQIKKEEPNQ